MSLVHNGTEARSCLSAAAASRISSPPDDGARRGASKRASEQNSSQLPSMLLAEHDASASAAADQEVEETDLTAADILNPAVSKPDTQVTARQQDPGYSGNAQRPDRQHAIPDEPASVGAGEGPSDGADVVEKATRAVAPDLLRGLLMALMALDHCVVALHAWDHGQARDTESDSHPVNRWNHRLAFVIRTLTHLCAPGFTFLLGMGVVYLGRSRSRLGWSSMDMLRHFAARAAVLTLLSTAFGLLLTGGQVWFLNVVLFSLAIDYLLAGLLWMAIRKTEPLLAAILTSWIEQGSSRGERSPLLGDEDSGQKSASDRAVAIAWHFHNTCLLSLAGVAAWWNIWLSPNHGRCKDMGSPPSQPSLPTGVTGNPLLTIWFWVVTQEHVLSVFPPLAWLSFAILGLVYGRVMILGRASASRLKLGGGLAALAFILLFVATRLLHFGNLSEDCLHMPEHLHSDTNQYLASVQSFFYLIKYPPDVAFVAYTMAGSLLLLVFFGSLPETVTRRLNILVVYGSSALFFYLVHQLVLFGGATFLLRFIGHPGPNDPLTGRPVMAADNVAVYFGTWATCMAILYPMCRWYGAFKRTKSTDSIWRFF